MSIENRTREKVKICPFQEFRSLLKEIAINYPAEGERDKARLDSLRLSSARKLINEKTRVITKQGESAIRASEAALLDDWKPMKDYITQEIKAEDAFKISFGGKPSPFGFSLRNLQRSLDND